MQTQSQTKRFAMAHHRRRNDFAKALTFFFAATLINFVAKGEDFCKTTTRTAYLACRSGEQNDLQIALGKAANLSDPVTRKAAREQAMADYKEALEDCKDQREAREAVCERLGGAAYDPVIHSSNFVSNITNPFYPLVPGTTFYYLGGSESSVVSVTHNTRVILGVTCIEVHDVVYID